MKLVNRLLISGLSVALVALAVGDVKAQTVDELVEKHVAALGGVDKLAGVKTLVMERSLSVNGMDIPSKTTVVVGKAMRSETSMMGNLMVQVIDGSTGWMIRPAMMGGTGDPEEMPAAMVAQQAEAVDPFGPLVNYREKGHKVELVGKAKVDRKDAYHLKVTTKGGRLVDQYLDATTYLLIKSTFTTPNGEPGEVIYTDYKAFDGIHFARTTEMTGGPMGTIAFLLSKARVNPVVDEQIFRKGVK